MLHTPHQSLQAAATVPAQRTPERDDQAGPWHADAVCRRDEAGLFFAPSKEPTAARLSREQAAKRVCSGCPVLVECREHALVMPERTASGAASPPRSAASSSPAAAAPRSPPRGSRRRSPASPSRTGPAPTPSPTATPTPIPSLAPLPLSAAGEGLLPENCPWAGPPVPGAAAGAGRRPVPGGEPAAVRSSAGAAHRAPAPGFLRAGGARHPVTRAPPRRAPSALRARGSPQRARSKSTAL